MLTKLVSVAVLWPNLHLYKDWIMILIIKTHSDSIVLWIKVCVAAGMMPPPTSIKKEHSYKYYHVHDSSHCLDHVM